VSDWDTEWKGAPEFQEFAEALGVNTTQVMAATNVAGIHFVMYTPSEDGEGDIWQAFMQRGDDGVLQITKRGPTGNTTDDLKTDIERRLKERGLE
jgi:hypothetical protein